MNLSINYLNPSYLFHYLIYFIYIIIIILDYNLLIIFALISSLIVLSIHLIHLLIFASIHSLILIDLSIGQFYALMVPHLTSFHSSSTLIYSLALTYLIQYPSISLSSITISTLLSFT